MPREERDQAEKPTPQTDIKVKPETNPSASTPSRPKKKPAIDSTTKYLAIAVAVLVVGGTAMVMTEPEQDVEIETVERLDRPTPHKQKTAMAPVPIKRVQPEQMDIGGLDDPIDGMSDDDLSSMGFGDEPVPQPRAVQVTQQETPEDYTRRKVAETVAQMPTHRTSAAVVRQKTAPSGVKVFSPKDGGDIKSGDNPFMPKYLEATLAKMADSIVDERVKEIEEKYSKKAKGDRVSLDGDKKKADDEQDAFFTYSIVPNNIYVKEYTINRDNDVILQTGLESLKVGDSFYGGKVTNISDDRIYLTRKENVLLSKKGEKPVSYKEETKRYRIYYTIAFDGEDIIKKEIPTEISDEFSSSALTLN